MEELHHFSHPQHPLKLTEAHHDEAGTSKLCNGCPKPIHSKEGEPIFSCEECQFYLHKRCAELPVEITEHPLHPHHRLKLLAEPPYPKDGPRCFCDGCYQVCETDSFIYHCSWTSCNFDLHISCAFPDPKLDHPGHEHPLIFLKKPSIFCCDACGSESKGQAYVCVICQIWIHMSCAQLPSIAHGHDHNHPLTLSYCVPNDLRKYEIPCDYCFGKIPSKNWVYYCGPCRYILHLDCLGRCRKPPEGTSNLGKDGDKEKDLVKMPTRDMVEVIKHVLQKQQGKEILKIPKFVYVMRCAHRLILANVKNDPSSKDAEITCHRCADPIVSECCKCSQCNYFIHLTCAQLPEKLNYPRHDPKLFLLIYVWGMFECYACKLDCNGYLYQCQTCVPYRFDSVNHRWDKHPLQLSIPPFSDRPGEFYCEICEEEIHPRRWHYHCKECDQSFHPRCIPKVLYRNCTFGGTLEMGSHPHPLKFIREGGYHSRCDSCRELMYDKRGNPFSAARNANFFLHKRCAELPLDIKDHPLHPHHKLKLFAELPYLKDKYRCFCDGCYQVCDSCFIYHCSWISWHFDLHICCTFPDPKLDHPGHEHPLMFLQKPSHLQCALLPRINYTDDHNHPLSLSYCVPIEFRRYDSPCEYCFGKIAFQNWVYYCGPCRFMNFAVLDILTQMMAVNTQKKQQGKEILPVPKITNGSQIACNRCAEPIISDCCKCPQCNYFVHFTCAQLPEKLKYLNHDPKLHLLVYIWGMFKCFACDLDCNGYLYEYHHFVPRRWDVKYALLPTKLMHKSHQHPLLQNHQRSTDYSSKCSSCGKPTGSLFYSCPNCRFYLDYQCVTLPEIVNYRWDKHPLQLSIPPFSDRPGDFYCEICEEEIHPRRWHYHCKECDQSFHPRCIPKVLYRNCIFGGTLEFGSHPHPLKFVREGGYYSRCGSCPELMYDKLLFFAVAFSAVPLTLYVPPIRSFNLFVESVEHFFRQTTVHTVRFCPRLRLAFTRVLYEFQSYYDATAFLEVANDVSHDLKFSQSEAPFSYACAPLCYLLGVLTAARMADWIGRRFTLLFSATILFVGSVLMVSATNFPVFMVGRFCSALGDGYALMVPALYIAEISPVSSRRGFLTSFPEAFTSIGSLFGGVAMYWLPKISAHSGWRFIVGIVAVPSMFLCIGLFTTISESPYWLVMKDRLDDAKRILDKTSASLEESQLRLEEMIKAPGIPDENVSANAKSAKFCVALKELIIRPTPSVRQMFVTALALHFVQVACGVNITINQFSTNIFEQAGVTTESHQQFISYAFGLAGIGSNLVATVLVDKAGRRTLLLHSVAGTAFSLFGLAVGLTVIHNHPGQKVTWALAMCIISSLSCTVFYSIGIGPIAVIYSSEVFPQRLRAVGIGTVEAINVFTGWIVLISSILLVTLPIFPTFNVGLLFFSYAVVSFSGWIFIYLFVPETKDASLEEMETLFPGLGSFCFQRIKNSIRHMSQSRYMQAFFLYTLYTRYSVSLF
ncbi:OLC1v1036943C1 [Oldenlandia corymbosa var. corymbosa]|uniref:OLC1v1036943C1 n=1 Tax=Oldenlandia corymbosa var. corymbosa TaxID=529605 RepID=A0AAV1CXA2_OLDCO|nr:OLC1v1036943C1 [Oldenlandia corymbosa var. corymbosa]